MDGIMAEIRKLLSQGMSSREIINLGFAPWTIYKVQRDFRRKNSTGNGTGMKADARYKLLTPVHPQTFEHDLFRKSTQED